MTTFTMTVRKMFMLSKNDLKNIFRDPSIWMPMIAPVIILLLLREGIPILEGMYPAIVLYQALIVALMSCVNAIFPAFFVSFMMLDEKDHQLFAVFRVMPIAPQWFILYRVVFIASISFIFAFATIEISGLIKIELLKAIALSSLIALLAPLITLAVVTFAKNKIEGVTLLKGVNMALALPLVAFLVEAPWTRLLGIIPAYWIYKAFQVTSGFWWQVTLGILLHILLIIIVFRRFKNRVFQ